MIATIQIARTHRKRKQERVPTYGYEKRCVLRLELNVVRVGD